MELLFKCFVIKTLELFEQKITSEIYRNLLVALLNSVEEEEGVEVTIEASKIQLSTY